MHVYFYNICLAAVVGYALWRGGWPERAAALIMLVGSIASKLAYAPLAVRFTGVETGVFVIDVIVLAAFAALALAADRRWTLWLVAFQLIGVLAHVARLLDVEMPVNGYGIIIAIWSYPMLATIALGARSHWRSRTRQAAAGT